MKVQCMLDDILASALSRCTGWSSWSLQRATTATSRDALPSRAPNKNWHNLAFLLVPHGEVYAVARLALSSSETWDVREVVDAEELVR